MTFTGPFSKTRATRVVCPQALGMRVNFTVASEKNHLALSVLVRHTDIRCLLCDIDDHIAGHGRCARHGDDCPVPPAHDLDVVSAGLPCHPFSGQRVVRQGGEGRSGPAKVHPEFQIAMEKFHALISVRRPRARETQTWLAFHRLLLDVFFGRAFSRSKSLRSI